MMRFIGSILFIALSGILSGLQNPLMAQAKETITITGRVLNEIDNRPLVNVNVFIANTMLGSATDDDGRFTIKRVPLGTHELVFSMVGFEVKKSTLRITSTEDKTVDIKLLPQILKIPEVEVITTSNNEWQKHLKKFKKYFLGTSKNAEKCKLINAEVLDFSTDSAAEKFTAKANDILLIENRSLGYRLFYLLESFTVKKDMVAYFGKIRFNELTPNNQKEQKRWQKNRLKTYHGSLRHFLATISSKQVTRSGYLRDNGFLVYGMAEFPTDFSKPDLQEVDIVRLTSPGELPFERKLHFLNILQVVYTKEMEEREYVYWRMNYDKSAIRMNTQKRIEAIRPQAQSSWLVMNMVPAIIDVSGYLYNPLAVTVYGYWAWENVADLLPVEYTPE